MPGEIRVWQRSLQGRNPETVEWSFLTYFRQGKFPPKPSDISELVTSREQTVNYDVYSPVDATERQQAEASRQEFFQSDEYKQFLAKMKAEHGL